MPLAYYEPHYHYYPSLSLINHLYVSPLSLKYDTQKQFPKVCYCNYYIILYILGSQLSCENTAKRI